MKSENRWIYIGGVALLVILVVVGFMMRDQSSDQSDDTGGDGGHDGGGEEAGAAEGAALDASVVESTGEAGEAVEVGNVPSDPTECRAYCQDLADRGALSQGTSASQCVSQLCSAEASEEEGASEEVQAMTDPQLPEIPDDCQAQCRIFHQRGELREGTTVDDCIAAMCSSDGEE